ncbi:Hypothetical predicted protein, partial [Pelobates cultripes]
MILNYGSYILSLCHNTTPITLCLFAPLPLCLSSSAPYLSTPVLTAVSINECAAGPVRRLPGALTDTDSSHTHEMGPLAA